MPAPRNTSQLLHCFPLRRPCTFLSATRLVASQEHSPACFTSHTGRTAYIAALHEARSPLLIQQRSVRRRRTALVPTFHRRPRKEPLVLRLISAVFRRQREECTAACTPSWHSPKRNQLRKGRQIRVLRTGRESVPCLQVRGQVQSVQAVSHWCNKRRCRVAASASAKSHESASTQQQESQQHQQQSYEVTSSWTARAQTLSGWSVFSEPSNAYVGQVVEVMCPLWCNLTNMKIVIGICQQSPQS